MTKIFNLIIILFTIFFNNSFAHAQTDNLRNQTVVDLTHSLDEKFPYIPVPGITFPFKKVPIATIDKMNVAAYRWEIHEHIGTQIDAPSHFFKDGISIEQIPVKDLIAPLAVIDISERAKKDADATVTIQDILDWEKQYGKLPSRAAVFMYSGWEERVTNAKDFINADEEKTMHFPGFSTQAVKFLVEKREVVGIGVDTLSLDPGVDKEYKSHKAWLAKGKWGVECVANLKNVPPVGATVFVGATKVTGATGGPVRLIATFPNTKKTLNKDAVKKQLRGKWKSPKAEKAGANLFITREFKFSKKKWQIEALFYADENLKNPLFSFIGKGKYELENLSKTLPDTVNTKFGFEKKMIKLISIDKNVIAKFGFSNCNLIQGKTKDISKYGCSFFDSVSKCSQEFDLVKITGNKLQLGTRPADRNMCVQDKRPKSLGQAVIKIG